MNIICRIFGHKMKPRFTRAVPELDWPYPQKPPCACVRCGYDSVLDPLIAKLKELRS